MTYGGPFTTGYHHYVHKQNFSLEYINTDLRKEGPWVTPDALDGWIVKWLAGRPSADWPQGGPQSGLPSCILYPAVLSGLFWVFTPPLFSLVGLWSYWRDRTRPEARFALVLCEISLLFFCCYFYQGTRFMAAPASVLLAGAAARIALWLVGGPALPIAHQPSIERRQPRSRRSTAGNSLSRREPVRPVNCPPARSIVQTQDVRRPRPV